MTYTPVLTVLNNKGGVGKTTLAILTAEYASNVLGLRTLLLDWDGQMSATQALILTESIPGVGLMPIPNQLALELIARDENMADVLHERSTIADIFEGKEVLPYVIKPVSTAEGNGCIHLIAGNREGFRMLLESSPTERADSAYSHLVDCTTEQITDQLVTFCSDVDLVNDYDLIIIDSAPSDSPLFSAALRAATHVLCPYVPEPKAVAGIEGLIHAVVDARKRRVRRNERPEPLELVGIVPNMVDLRRVDHTKNIAEAMEAAGNYHFPAGLGFRHLTAYSRLTEFERPKPGSVFALPPKTTARKDAEHIFAYIFHNLSILSNTGVSACHP